MVRKMFCAVLVMTIAIGFVAADEFSALITKVDGDKVSYYKTKKGKKTGDEITATAAKDAKIAKGKKDDKKWVAGDAIESGLKADVFAKIGENGVAVRITTDDEKKTITQVLVTKKK